jgi:hypothetical protein
VKLARKKNELKKERDRLEVREKELRQILWHRYALLRRERMVVKLW